MKGAVVGRENGVNRKQEREHRTQKQIPAIAHLLFAVFIAENGVQRKADNGKLKDDMNEVDMNFVGGGVLMQPGCVTYF